MSAQPELVRTDARDAEPMSAPLELLLELRCRDREVIQALLEHEPGRDRDEFALSALRIGVVALRQVRGQLDGQTVRGELDRMLDALREGLAQHQSGLTERMGATLREYFDPKSGRFAERVEKLVQDDGELASVIRRQVGGDGSELARTLAAHIGPESALMKLVDPEHKGGLLSTISGLVQEELVGQRDRILAEFSLDNRDGSLARLVAELRQGHGKLTEDLEGRIDEMVSEFSLDDEGSALSRLVHRVERAQQQITNEFSLDSDESALARMKKEILGIVHAQTETIARMEKTVAAEMAALASRRAEAERSTRHGVEFEDTIAAHLELRAQQAGDLYERTGAMVGLIKNCKKGDGVLTLGPEHRAAGARIVIEAKKDKSFTLAAARQELGRARKNRGADLGLFVFSSSRAPEGLVALDRIGEDVFVIVDPERPEDLLLLDAAVSICRALALRGRDQEQATFDVGALERAIRDVERQAQGLDEIKRSAQTIESSTQKIQNRVRILERNLVRGVEALDDSAAAARAAFEE